MTRKNMGSRLADSLRQARQVGQPAQPGSPSGTKTADPSSDQAAAAKQVRPSNTVAKQPAAPGSKDVVLGNEQAPVPNLDKPWDNLHPDRIWPD